MIARLLVLAGALWLWGCGEPEREWPAPSPALWEISDANGVRGWLFGTIHALPKGAVWRTPVLDAAIAEADLFVVEIANLGDSNEAQRAFAARARARGLPPLLERIPASDRPALADMLDRAGRNARELDSLKTWAAALQVAGIARNADPEDGVDRALLRLGKPAIGLETFAGQFSLFDSLPETDQADLLAGIVREAQAEGGDARMIAWLRGDMETLERDAGSGILGYPRLREALLDGRNRVWVERIAEVLQDGRKPFVAVGAGHMLGAESLPALLAERGYSVRRVTRALP